MSAEKVINMKVTPDQVQMWRILWYDCLGKEASAYMSLRDLSEKLAVWAMKREVRHWYAV